MTSHDYLRLNAPKWYVALLRIFMGAFFLRVAWERVLDLRADAGAFKTKLAALEATTQFPWFWSYFQRVLDPVRDTIFAPALWVAAPVVVGVSLVLGLFSRLGAAVGALLVAHVWLLRYHSASTRDLMLLELQFAVLVMLCAAAAGRAWGVDGIFWRHRMLATYVSDDSIYRAPRVPIVTDIPPIELSDTRPGSKPAAKPEEK